MQHIKAIIFDAGGTLVQGAVPWYELYGLALKVAQHPLPLRELALAYEAAIRKMVADRQSVLPVEAPGRTSLNSRLAVEFGLTEARLQYAIDEVIFDHPEALHLTCIDGSHEVLAQLRLRGYRLGVISNWSADLPRSLTHLGLGELLDAVFASETIGYSKPNSAAFLLPLNRMHLTPGVCAFVGDLYHIDVLGAREVGLTPILLDPLRLGLHRDVQTVGSLWELLDIFTGA
jgi:FMN phosphatase YigB (HAD superfamily)